MQDALKSLLDELHELFFKPHGFTKRRNRFRRQIESVIQDVEFQSSQWNSVGSPVVFYVNISCGFTDIPVCGGRKTLSGQGRIGGLAPDAPSEFHLAVTNYALLRDQLTVFLTTALHELPKHYTDVEKRARQGLRTPIPLPANWED